jgi:hypothetical protein
MTVRPEARNDALTLASNVVFPVPTPPDTRTFAGSVGDDAHAATASLAVTDSRGPPRRRAFPA